MFKENADLHVLRHYSSFIVVSHGQVIHITDPEMISCPLADVLYPELKRVSGSGDHIRSVIKNTIERKIRDHGCFSERRELRDEKVAVPYGASEMMMYALRKKRIDVAVVVCEGAGTVITDDPAVVQGIGRRMNGLFFTTPIKTIQDKLIKYGCVLVSEKAGIDQLAGIKAAAAKGHKNIAVTVNGFRGESLSAIRDTEREYCLRIFILTVCTTGVDTGRSGEIAEHSDVVWTCGSMLMRQDAGKRALLQFSKAIPVFVLTQNGIEFVKSYFECPEVLNPYASAPILICDDCKGEKVRIGDFRSRICNSSLPVTGKPGHSPLLSAKS